MITLAAYQMELHPPRDQSAQACMFEVCTAFSEFITRYYRGKKIRFAPLDFTGKCIGPKEGHSLTATRYIGANHQLATIEWDVAMPENPNYLCRVSCGCAADRRAVEVQYRTQVWTRSIGPPGGGTEVKVDISLFIPTGLMVSLLRNRVGTIEGWEIPVAVKLLEAADMPEFVDAVLLNPARTLPVLLLAADGRFKSTPSLMQTVQRSLLGVAQVAALMSTDATAKLTELLGTDHACSVGLVRIYHPKFTRTAAPKHHPLLHMKDLGPSLKSKSLGHFLHQKVMAPFRTVVPDGPVTRSARAALCAEFLEQAAKAPSLLTRIEAAEAKLSLVASERERMLVERDRALAERDRLHLAERGRLQQERDEANRTIRSLQGKLTEQQRGFASQADELLRARAELGTSGEDLRKLQTQYDAVQEQQRTAHETLAKTTEQLQTLRDRLLAKNVPAIGGDRELEEEVQRAWQESGQLMAELETARQDLAALQEEVVVCKQNLLLLAADPGGERRIAAAHVAPAAVSQTPRTILEAMRIASERFADVLVVWEDAWRSAEKSLFLGPTRVLQALQAIAEVGRDYFIAANAGQPLGPLEQAFHNKVPYKYAPCESKMTMAMHGHERVFQGPKQRREIQRHLTLGGGGANCLQIYFDFDDASQQVIIAYCGQHLPNYR